MHETPASYFNLESSTALTAGWHPVRGWLVAKPGHHLTDIRARIGGREFPGAYGFPRADLAAHFQAGRPWLPAEFIINLEFAPGTTPVQFEALDLAGIWHPVLSVDFVISADGVRPRAPVADDPVSAMDFGRATRLGFLLGQPVDPPWPRMIRGGHRPFHGYLAQPTAVPRGLYGRLEVLGWLFHDDQPVRRVFASTDLLTFQPLPHGGEFDDVATRYPGHPFARDARFQGWADFPGNLPAPLALRIYAELADGSTHLVLVSHCRPVTTEELKLAWPAFSPFRFPRYWRQERNRLNAAGYPLAAGSLLWHEFWLSLREYRALALPSPRSATAPSPAKPEPGRPLRLLLVTHNLNREGAPLLFVEYAAYLARHAWAGITVLSGRDGALRETFVQAGATVRILPADPAAAASPAELQAGLRRLAAELAGDGFDLVVANTLQAFWGVLLAECLGRPSLLYIHESSPPAVFFARAAPALLVPACTALRRATAVSFNTPATQAYYAGLGSGTNFHLQPAWIDVAALEEFRAAHARDALRRELGIGPGELLVANIGTVCERKGQHDFIRAIEWLARLEPALAARCRFVMVGGRDTEYDADLAKDVAALGRTNVQIVPETVRPLAWFASADVFVCTSYEESFPRVVLEAMAFGVPVVSTRVHGIPYMLRDDAEALLVAPGDIAGLAAALLAALREPPAGRLRAERARQRVAEFDAASLLPRHARFTAEVAAQGRPRP